MTTGTTGPGARRFLVLAVVLALAALLVPASTVAVGSTLTACNQSSASTKIRIAVAVAGAADEAKQYLVYDLRLQGNEPYMMTIGPTLAATAVVRVYSSSGTVSFNLFGVEKV